MTVIESDRFPPNYIKFIDRDFSQGKNGCYFYQNETVAKIRQFGLGRMKSREDILTGRYGNVIMFITK